jgi:hypothetical protein
VYIGDQLMKVTKENLKIKKLLITINDEIKSDFNVDISGLSFENKVLYLLIQINRTLIKALK